MYHVDLNEQLTDEEYQVELDELMRFAAFVKEKLAKKD
jgi:hypothetical protein